MPSIWARPFSNHRASLTASGAACGRAAVHAKCFALAATGALINGTTAPMTKPTPVEPFLTGYDMDHLVTYLRLLNADADGADWREVARIVLDLDVEKNPERASQSWRTSPAVLSGRNAWSAVTVMGTRGCLLPGRGALVLPPRSWRAPRPWSAQSTCLHVACAPRFVSIALHWQGVPRLVRGRNAASVASVSLHRLSLQKL